MPQVVHTSRDENDGNSITTAPSTPTLSTEIFVIIGLTTFIITLIAVIAGLLRRVSKDNRKRNSEKEEWLNHIYEGLGKEVESEV